jgi:hypothetical protein
MIVFIGAGRWKINCMQIAMVRCLIVAILFAVLAAAKPETGKFEGIWKAEKAGKPYAVLTILSDHPPRGTLSRDGGMDLYMQDVRIAKGALRFKTIDPNDGLVQYELKIVSPSEGTLALGPKETVTVKRN